MKYLMGFTIFFLFCCCYWGMDFFDARLSVDNKSNIGIGALVNIQYPDTSIEKTHNNHIYPNEKSYIELLNRYWKTVLDENEFITVYFVSWEELEKYNFEKKDSLKILKKYTLSEAILDSLNWTLSYP